jgi:hypothetical protein
MLLFIHFKVRQARIAVLRVVKVRLYFSNLLSNAMVQQKELSWSLKTPNAAIERLREVKQSSFPLIARNARSVQTERISSKGSW